MQLERLEAPPTSSAHSRPGPGEAPANRTGARAMSASEASRPADRVAGFLCAFSFALSGIAVVRNPGLLATAAILVALVATVMTRTHRTLASVAVGVGALAFFVGMVLAVLTDNALY
jgi:hypothetical protein